MNQQQQQQQLDEGKPNIRKHYIYYFEEDYEYDNDVEILVFQLIELITTLICHPNLDSVIRFGTFPLINCLSHYMLLSKAQENSWITDNNHFIIEDDEENIYSLRNICLQLIGQLVNNYGSVSIQSVITVAERFLFMQDDDEEEGEFFEKFIDNLDIDAHIDYFPKAFDKEKLVELIKTSGCQNEHPSFR